MSRPDTVIVAGAIVEGNGTEHDSWVKHQKKFDDFNFQSRDEFKAHIDKTLNAKATTVLEVRGATIYANKATETVVVHDPIRIDQGTCFRPTMGVDDYIEQKANAARARLGREPLKIVGGHDAFYDAMEQRDLSARHLQSAGVGPESSAALLGGRVVPSVSNLSGGTDGVPPAAGTASSAPHDEAIPKIIKTGSAHVLDATSAKPLAEHLPDSAVGVTQRIAIGSAAAEAAGGLASSGAAAGTIAVGSVERASVVALKAAGRALGPLGLAVNAATLEAAYDTDGKKIGAHTGQAASEVAGGWAGAVAGAEGGVVVGAAVGSVVPVVGTAAGAMAGGVVGAVAGGVTGNWVGRRIFDRVKGMFGSPVEIEAPAASPKPEVAPKAPGGVSIAGAGARSTSDVGAGTTVAWANTVAAGLGGAVEAIRAREVEARAMWQASVMAKPAAQGTDPMTAAGVGSTASARSEAGVAGSAQSGAGASNVSAVDGRAHWSLLAKGAAAASEGAGVTAGPGGEGRAVAPGSQAPGPESLAPASVPEAAVAPGHSLRLRS